ncbi:hypothetical protein GGD46_004328 [Rhizobium lusitanum]|uniref:Uncharacterized protein n=1 Tax=Rhizobium lusitanum TaxID=293958 RepID=A0A7X0MFH0_9HYPH|nr:hypothetical protein [Rhizobium lusitanum]
MNKSHGQLQQRQEFIPANRKGHLNAEDRVSGVYH